ncbi:hypothetical protein ARSEF4850_007271 [Beauveria asiatica]
MSNLVPGPRDKVPNWMGWDEGGDEEEEEKEEEEEEKEKEEEEEEEEGEEEEGRGKAWPAIPKAEGRAIKCTSVDARCRLIYMTLRGIGPQRRVRGSALAVQFRTNGQLQSSMTNRPMCD